MWEEWRAQIDRAVRDAELADSKRYDHERALRAFQVTTLPRARGQAPREVPRKWRVRLTDARARPIP